MGLNINLFVHGVPMGQKIWGSKGEDGMYISSFYGPKWDSLPELMKVDVMTFGEKKYCYYSFIKGQNVYDVQGRGGSYLALTLKIDALYSDVRNIYNILKATYEKMCIGLCVSKYNEGIKFVIDDFQKIDAQLKGIEKHILNYISNFSVEGDLKNLIGFANSEKGKMENINLHECTESVAIEKLKQNGCLLTSPYFMSANSVKIVAQCKSEVEMVKQKAQQELMLQQRQFQEKLDALKSLHQQEAKHTPVPKSTECETHNISQCNKKHNTHPSSNQGLKIHTLVRKWISRFKNLW